LAKVLASAPDAEMPAGDFVRWARQVVDLLGQIAEAAARDDEKPSSARAAAQAAIGAVNRGVLAYTSLS
jgi:ATP-dependent RNA helicase HelY